MDSIYSLLIGPIQILISWTWSTLKFLKNIRSFTISLTNGNFAAQPNNRILWHVNSYTTDNDWPDYKVQTTYWDAENPKFVTEDSDKMFYQMEEKMNLSRNFTLSELTKSDTAIRKGINNNPNAEQIEKLKALCENILQPVRDHFGRVKVTSGFRSSELCVSHRFQSEQPTCKS